MDGGVVRRIYRPAVLTVALLLSLLGFAVIQAPTPASAAMLNPYGFSVWGYQNRVTASGLKWVRLQRDWSSIETSPGAYNFTGLDQDVARANAAGVNATVPLQDAPSFRLTQVCNGVNLFPGPNEMSTFASIVAARYNGRNGHGYVASFEIGNEEYDGYWGGSWANTLPCRAANYYGPVLRAGYEAVKAQSPNALVGMFGMWWVDTGHVQSYMTWLYANGYGRYMDFANFHYYPGGNPAVTSGSTPSFDLEWSTIHAVQVAYGDGAKPVWCTETGWAVSSVNQGSNPVVTLAQQSQYLQYVLDSSRNSGVMQRVFIYMISDTGYDGMNIYTPSGPLPSYNMLESYMAQYPAWGAAPAPTPTPTPTPAPTPTPTPTPTPAPTPTPTPAPTPTPTPTAAPTPTPAPTAATTAAPTPAPTASPSANPGQTRKGSKAHPSTKPSGNATALVPSSSGSLNATGNFSAEVKNPGPLGGLGHLIAVIPNAIGSAGMMVVLWLSLGALFWVVLRVLSLLSVARRRRAAGF